MSENHEISYLELEVEDCKIMIRASKRLIEEGGQLKIFHEKNLATHEARLAQTEKTLSELRQGKKVVVIEDICFRGNPE